MYKGVTVQTSVSPSSFPAPLLSIYLCIGIHVIFKVMFLLYPVNLHITDLLFISSNCPMTVPFF